MIQGMEAKMLFGGVKGCTSQQGGGGGRRQMNALISARTLSPCLRMLFENPSKVQIRGVAASLPVLSARLCGVCVWGEVVRENIHHVTDTNTRSAMCTHNAFLLRNIHY